MGGAVKKKTKPSALATRGNKVVDWPDKVLVTSEDKPVTLRDCYESLVASNGKMARCAIKLKVNLTEFARLVEVTPVLFEVVYLYRELLLDRCETVIEEAVNEDPQLAMEVLKRLGKRRGYGDRDVQAPSKIQIEFVKDWRGDRSMPEAKIIEIEKEGSEPPSDPLLDD